MKTALRRVPVLGPLAASAWSRLRAARERPIALRAMREAHHPLGSRIADALCRCDAVSAVSAGARLEAIEKERHALSLCQEPLVDGSLDAPGLYDEGVTLADACRVSKPPRAARLMYELVRELAPEQVLELGTNLGISSAYQAAALARNGRGRLVTLEASPYRVRAARELHARVGLDVVTYRQGLFAETLSPVLAEFAPIDFAFIDGHHQYEPTLAYFDEVWRHATSDAVFVFDDIRWSEGMERAWRALQDDARVALAVDLGSVGICVTRPQAAEGARDVLPPFWSALVEPR